MTDTGIEMGCHCDVRAGFSDALERPSNGGARSTFWKPYAGSWKPIQGPAGLRRYLAALDASREDWASYGVPS
jgi:hypothetical protein